MPERKIYKFRLNLTAAQEDDLAWMAGARRFVFNWALNRRRETYKETGKSISRVAFSLELTATLSDVQTIENPRFWVAETKLYSRDHPASLMHIR